MIGPMLAILDDMQVGASRPWSWWGWESFASPIPPQGKENTPVSRQEQAWQLAEVVMDHDAGETDLDRRIEAIVDARLQAIAKSLEECKDSIVGDDANLCEFILRQVVNALRYGVPVAKRREEKQSAQVDPCPCKFCQEDKGGAPTLIDPRTFAPVAVDPCAWCGHPVGDSPFSFNGQRTCRDCDPARFKFREGFKFPKGERGAHACCTPEPPFVPWDPFSPNDPNAAPPPAPTPAVSTPTRSSRCCDAAVIECDGRPTCNKCRLGCRVKEA